MKTDDLFREDATLLACDAFVTAHVDGGVLLDRTVCYPLGGGQAGDTGWLVAGDQRWRVTDTRKSKEHPEAIVHLIDGEALPPVGTAVRVEVDAARRQAGASTPRRTCCARCCRTRSTAARSPRPTRGWTSIPTSPSTRTPSRPD